MVGTFKSKLDKLVAEKKDEGGSHKTFHDFIDLKNEGLIVEFGVSSGGTFREICGIVAPRIVYGFDWFWGLPEDWTPGNTKGTFSNNGQRPSDIPANGHIIEGLVEDTAPKFFEEKKQPIVFAHMDLDLYKGTKAALDAMAPYMTNETVLLFDELIADGGKENEQRAFAEFLHETGYDCEYLGRRDWDKWGFRILKPHQA